MKRSYLKVAIYASLVLLLLPGLATSFEAKAQTTAPAAGQCTDENKAAWYGEFTKFRTTDATKAYEAAKKYLGACPTEEGQIPAYLKKWVAAYEKEARKLKLNDLFINQRKYADAQALAKEILKDEPDYLPAIMDLGYGGYVVAVTTKNEAGNAEAVNFAKQAIQAIEGGKTLENWSPFKTKEDALGYLYYSMGYMQRESNPAEALKSFLKAGSIDGEIKKNAQTYVFIAAAYEKEYEKQSAAYEAAYKDKPETPESKLAVANINQVVDRIIDALARAVAAAGTDANQQASKAQWMTRLTELYKFRHGGVDTELPKLIATVLSTPLPPVPTPLTELPAAPATSTTTPATGSQTSTGNNVTTGASAPAKTAVTTAPTTTAENAKSTAKPAKRNNHRRN